jgi:cell division protein FtsN
MPQSMKNQELEQEEDKTYHKSIDALIEDVEIEAEIEAEKKIRSKNARLFTIALVGIALVAFTGWYVSKSSSTKGTTEVALPELTQNKSTMKTESAGIEDSPSPFFLHGLGDSSDSILITKPSPVTSENREPLSEGASKAEPDMANGNTVEKVIAPPVGATTSKEPESQLIEKAPVVVPQPVKTKASDAPAVKQTFVQLGTFSVEDNAKNFLKEIKKKGFQPTIQIKSGKAKKHIVFVGGFSTKESGSQALNDLKSKGFNSVMEKLADNSYTIVLGKFSTASQAEAIRDQLSLEGFLSSTKVSNVSRMIYIVQIGSFDSLSQAKVMQKKVGRAGFNDSFIR